MNFLSQWLQTFTESPIATLVFSFSVLLMVLHLVLPSIQFLQNALFSFWSRGEAKAKSWYTIGASKLLRIVGVKGFHNFTIVKMGSLSKYEYNVASYEKAPSPDGFVIRTRFKDYIGREHDHISDYVGRSYINKKDYEFATQADAIDFLHSKVNLWPLGAIWLAVGGLALTAVSLVLDMLLFDYFFQTLVAVSLIGSVCLVLFGGRAMFDVKKKFESIDKVIEENAKK